MNLFFAITIVLVKKGRFIMFKKEIYIARRKELRELIGAGVVLLIGNGNSPIDYPSNHYPFAQTSEFLYYIGIGEVSNLAAIIDFDEDKEILFGDNVTVDDEVWMGPQPTVAELASKSGINNVSNITNLASAVKQIIKEKRTLHFLPAFRSDNIVRLSKLIGIPIDNVNNNASSKLIKAAVIQRSVKTMLEVEEIEKGIEITREIYLSILKNVKPGIFERDLLGIAQKILTCHGSSWSFQPIITINGKTLHNPYYHNELKNGDLLLIDIGTRSSEQYCSDITRTYPVSGKFTDRQKAIYELVLNMQLTAIEMIKPGIIYKDIHLKAAEIAIEGLKNLGLMKGNTKSALENGAHALFFPHGLGHMLGLEDHDMASLNENNVGYDDEIERSSQFGLAYLRMARGLKPGFVITVEPGIYFIPKLIDLWKSENKFKEFIVYEKVDKYRDFEGIRIEDDVLVTEKGCRVLGKKSIPKYIDDIEKIMCTE